MIVNIPLKLPFHISKGTVGSTAKPVKKVIIRIWTDCDLIGVGETSPMPEWMYGTAENAVGAIHLFYEPVLIGCDPLVLQEVEARLRGALPAGGDVFARCALDLACYDLLGKALGVPVHTLMGGTGRSHLPCLYGIGIAEPEQMAEVARQRSAQGFQLIKVKVGGPSPELDLQRVRAVREAVPAETMVCVDANEAYTRPQARWFAERLKELALAYLEQPLPASDLTGLAHLRGTGSLPIMVDESVKTPAEMMRAAAAEAADYVFCKLDKSGGIAENRRIVAVAQAAGVIPVAGAMLNAGVGTAALIHLAAGHGMTFPGGYNGPLVLEHDLLEQHLAYEDGMVRIPTGSGLGVELDEAALRYYRAA